LSGYRSIFVVLTTVQRYLDVLDETFMARQLPSWRENVGKRQVKAPKVYVRDSGMLHALLGLNSAREIDVHPKVGASWEGFALSAVASRLQARPEECFFWATHSGAELDLLVIRGNRRLGLEFKRSTTPSVTRSMHTAIQDLRLRRLWVVHAGERVFDLGRRIRAVPLPRILEELEPLR
jgi:predicted AAA+ superfamily ATPase